MSFYNDVNELESRIKGELNISSLENLGPDIDKTIEQLQKIKTTIPARIEHVKKNITKKYYVTLWKQKGEYKDTDTDFTVISEKRINGAHYSVSVHEYIYDLSLIGTKERYSNALITVPLLRSEYSYTYSRHFSWKKKELAYQYIRMLAGQWGITLYDATTAPDTVKNDGCLLVSGNNTAKSVWLGKFDEVETISSKPLIQVPA